MAVAATVIARARHGVRESIVSRRIGSGSILPKVRERPRLSFRRLRPLRDGRRRHRYRARASRGSRIHCEQTDRLRVDSAEGSRATSLVLPPSSAPSTCRHGACSGRSRVDLRDRADHPACAGRRSAAVAQLLEQPRRIRSRELAKSSRRQAGRGWVRMTRTHRIGPV
jgi:hypothetical protein